MRVFVEEKARRRLKARRDWRAGAIFGNTVLYSFFTQRSAFSLFSLSVCALLEASTVLASHVSPTTLRQEQVADSNQGASGQHIASGESGGILIAVKRNLLVASAV